MLGNAWALQTRDPSSGPGFPLIHCVIWSKLLNLSEPQVSLRFLISKMGELYPPQKGSHEDKAR